MHGSNTRREGDSEGVREQHRECDSEGVREQQRECDSEGVTEQHRRWVTVKVRGATQGGV